MTDDDSTPKPAPHPPLQLPPPRSRWRRITRDQWIIAGVIVAIAVAGVLYRVLVIHKLEQTAALFIGLPAVLALVITLTPQAKSATGVIMKSITVALLMAGPVLGEGFICVVMAAPLFYLVGAIVGVLVDRGRRRERPTSLQVVVLLPILLVSLEGTTPALSFPRRQEVTVKKLVNGSPADVERMLARQPVFDRALPAYLRMKFPLPVAASGEGLTLGAERRIHFAGGEGKPGDLALCITEHGPSSVTFTAQSDTSHIAHWLTWRASRVSWRAVGEGRTEVEWTIAYDRELDPAWYFAPWERYATGLAAGYLIDTLSSPRMISPR
jgi:hypothetical protein